MIGGKLNKRITLLRGKVRVIVANIKEVINKGSIEMKAKEGT
jgi:hypothetical protein